MGKIFSKESKSLSVKEKLAKVGIHFFFLISKKHSIVNIVIYFQLHTAYEKHLLPLEKETLFDKLCDPPYREADIQAKPILLMMGQYSTGKTTFIRSLLGREYPGSRIAAEAATDNFIAVMKGDHEEVRPGNQ